MADLEPWRCEGVLRTGRACGRLLARIGPLEARGEVARREVVVQLICPRCRWLNTLVLPVPRSGILDPSTV